MKVAQIYIDSLSAQIFKNYLKKHSERIVNYQELSTEGLCSIGSGAVESAVKQIGKRLKISGASVEIVKRDEDATTEICLP